MLARKYRLTKTKDFQRIFKEGRYFDNVFFVIRAAPNHLVISRFGFIIGLKVSKKAVQRHEIQKQLREIIRLNLSRIKSGFDIIVLAKSAIVNQKRAGIEAEIIKCFQKAGIYA